MQLEDGQGRGPRVLLALHGPADGLVQGAVLGECWGGDAVGGADGEGQPRQQLQAQGSLLRPEYAGGVLTLEARPVLVENVRAMAWLGEDRPAKQITR